VSRHRRFIPRPYRALDAIARKSGWTVAPTGSGHIRWRPPAGEIVITSSTPDGRTSVIKDRARLRKAGLTEEST
jgi:hypothetical protein